MAGTFSCVRKAGECTKDSLFLLLILLLLVTPSTHLHPSKSGASHLFRELSSAAFLLDANRFTILWRLVSKYDTYEAESKKLFLITLLAKGDAEARKKILLHLFSKVPSLRHSSWDRTNLFKDFPLFSPPFNSNRTNRETISALEIALFTPCIRSPLIKKLFRNTPLFENKETMKTILNRIIDEEKGLGIRRRALDFYPQYWTPLERKIHWFIHKNPYKNQAANRFIKNCLCAGANSQFLKRTILWQESFLIMFLSTEIPQKANTLIRKQFAQVIFDLETANYRFFVSSTKPTHVYYFLRGILELYNSFFGSISLFELTTKILLNTTKSGARLFAKATKDLNRFTQPPGIIQPAGTYFKTSFDLWKTFCSWVPQKHFGRKKLEEFHQYSWLIEPFSTKRVKMGLKERIGFIQRFYKNAFIDCKIRFLTP